MEATRASLSKLLEATSGVPDWMLGFFAGAFLHLGISGLLFFSPDSLLRFIFYGFLLAPGLILSFLYSD